MENPDIIELDLEGLALGSITETAEEIQGIIALTPLDDTYRSQILLGETPYLETDDSAQTVNSATSPASLALKTEENITTTFNSEDFFNYLYQRLTQKIDNPNIILIELSQSLYFKPFQTEKTFGSIFIIAKIAETIEQFSNQLTEKDHLLISNLFDLVLNQPKQVVESISESSSKNEQNINFIISTLKILGRIIIKVNYILRSSETQLLKTLVCAKWSPFLNEQQKLDLFIAIINSLTPGEENLTKITAKKISEIFVKINMDNINHFHVTSQCLISIIDKIEDTNLIFKYLAQKALPTFCENKTISDIVTVFKIFYKINVLNCFPSYNRSIKVLTDFACQNFKTPSETILYLTTSLSFTKEHLLGKNIDIKTKQNLLKDIKTCEEKLYQTGLTLLKQALENISNQCSLILKDPDKYKKTDSPTSLIELNDILNFYRQINSSIKLEKIAELGMLELETIIYPLIVKIFNIQLTKPDQFIDLLQNKNLDLALQLIKQVYSAFYIYENECATKKIAPDDKILKIQSEIKHLFIILEFWKDIQNSLSTNNQSIEITLLSKLEKAEEIIRLKILNSNPENTIHLPISILEKNSILTLVKYLHKIIKDHEIFNIFNTHESQPRDKQSKTILNFSKKIKNLIVYDINLIHLEKSIVLLLNETIKNLLPNAIDRKQLQDFLNFTRKAIAIYHGYHDFSQELIKLISLENNRSFSKISGHYYFEQIKKTMPANSIFNWTVVFSTISETLLEICHESTDIKRNELILINFFNDITKYKNTIFENTINAKNIIFNLSLLDNLYKLLKILKASEKNKHDLILENLIPSEWLNAVLQFCQKNDISSITENAYTTQSAAKIMNEIHIILEPKPPFVDEVSDQQKLSDTNQATLIATTAKQEKNANTVVPFMLAAKFSDEYWSTAKKIRHRSKIKTEKIIQDFNNNPTIFSAFNSILLPRKTLLMSWICRHTSITELNSVDGTFFWMGKIDAEKIPHFIKNHLLIQILINIHKRKKINLYGSGSAATLAITDTGHIPLDIDLTTTIDLTCLMEEINVALSEPELANIKNHTKINHITVKGYNKLIIECNYGLDIEINYKEHLKIDDLFSSRDLQHNCIIFELTNNQVYASPKALINTTKHKIALVPRTSPGYYFQNNTSALVRTLLSSQDSSQFYFEPKLSLFFTNLRTKNYLNIKVKFPSIVKAFNSAKSNPIFRELFFYKLLGNFLQNFFLTHPEYREKFFKSFSDSDKKTKPINVQLTETYNPFNPECKNKSNADFLNQQSEIKQQKNKILHYELATFFLPYLTTFIPINSTLNPEILNSLQKDNKLFCNLREDYLLGEMENEIFAIWLDFAQEKISSKFGFIDAFLNWLAVKIDPQVENKNLQTEGSTRMVF